MIFIPLLLGAAIVGIVSVFWKEIVQWLKRAIQKVSSIVAGVVVGFKVFIRKMGEAVKEISKHYSQVNNHWQETVVTRTIDESQVPKEILTRAKKNQDLDITKELELELENAG